MFPSKAGRFRKSLLVFLALILSARSGTAATNEIPVGNLAVGNIIYTNAVITRVTPAYALVNYEAGVAQIPMSNMPAVYQDQFGYTPQKAAQFLDEERQLQKKQQAALRAEQASLRARLGTNRPVRITAIYDGLAYGGYPFCTVDGIRDGILVENLPDSVRQFMAGYRQLQADVASCQQQLNRLKAVPAPVRPATTPTGKIMLVGKGGNYILVDPPPDNRAAVRQEVEKRLIDLTAQLATATSNYDLYTTIIAHPSGQFYVEKPIWICIGIPPAAAAR
jgi:hypothetical protein